MTLFALDLSLKLPAAAMEQIAKALREQWWAGFASGFFAGLALALLFALLRSEK